jgi:hypothetical protein
MSVATIVVVALLAQAATPGQTQPRTPPRDPRVATTPTGSGIVRGQVIDATNGAPIRRATVWISGPPIRENPPSTVTDDEGRFEVRDLPAGKFTVTARKAGYFTGGPERRQTGPPPTVEVADKQVADKLILKLSRGGVIVGRVMDEAGEPEIHAELSTTQYSYGPNGRTLTTSGGFGMIRTDDLGGFRIYGLPPGQYYVVAQPLDGFFGAPPGGDVGPTKTFYPNSPDVGTAQRVTVAAGRETGPVLITLVSTKLSRVRGRAIMSNGQPFAASQVNVLVREEGEMGRGGTAARTTADGSFEIAGLPPGTYELQVRPGNFGRDNDGEFARQTITVSGHDIDGLVLLATRPGIVRGRVVTDDLSPLPKSPMHVMAVEARPGFRFNSTPAVVKDDHTFELKGVFGQRLFRHSGYISGPSDGDPWLLKAVMLNGTDIINKPIDIAPGAVIEGLELVFTRKVAELSGTVTIDGGARLEDATIILFPADESLWHDTFRFIRIARPDKDGNYKIEGLVANDDYLLVIALQLEPGQYMDPDFLRSVRNGAMRLSLTEGEKKNVGHLRVTATPQ